MRFLLVSIVMLSGCFFDSGAPPSGGTTAPGDKDSGVGAYVAGSAGRRHGGSDGAIVDLERDAAERDDAGGAAGAPAFEDASSGDAALEPDVDASVGDAAVVELDAGSDAASDAGPACCRYADEHHNAVDVCPSTINAHTGKPYPCTCLLEGDDTDNDGILDCEDACPLDHKSAPRRCGCAVVSSSDPTC